MAVTEQITRIDTITAGEALAASLFVGYDGKECLTGAKSLGVAIFDAELGQDVSVAISGKKLVIAGGTLAVGDALTSDADGKAVAVADVAVSINSGATQVVSTAADGDITTVTGGVLPIVINGYARTAATVGELVVAELK